MESFEALNEWIFVRQDKGSPGVGGNIVKPYSGTVMCVGNKVGGTGQWKNPGERIMFSPLGEYYEQLDNLGDPFLVIHSKDIVGYISTSNE